MIYVGEYREKVLEGYTPNCIPVTSIRAQGPGMSVPGHVTLPRDDFIHYEDHLAQHASGKENLIAKDHFTSATSRRPHKEEESMAGDGGWQSVRLAVEEAGLPRLD